VRPWKFFEKFLALMPFVSYYEIKATKTGSRAIAFCSPMGISSSCHDHPISPNPSIGSRGKTRKMICFGNIGR